MFRSAFRSISNFSIYKEIYRNSFGKSLLYLLFVGLIVYAVSTASFLFVLNQGVTLGLGDIRNELPEFRLENGRLYWEGTQPTVYDNNDLSGQIIIIDTTGITPVEEIQKARLQGLMFTSDKAYIYQGGNLQTVPLQTLQGVTLNKDTILNFLSKLPLIVGILSVFFFVFWMLWKFIGVLFLAMAGYFFVKVMGRAPYLMYKNLINISIYAMTLPWLLMLLNTLAGAYAGFGIPGFLMFFIYWGTAITYMVLAVRSIADENLLQNY